MTITIERQIEAVQREISMRRRVYPRRVQERLMTQDKADEEIEVMEAVLHTLQAQPRNQGALL